jgi:DNA gyrase subunit A
LFCTKLGTVKKTVLSEYANPRINGIKAIKVEPGDELIDVQITSGTNDIILATRHGLSIRFHESDVRAMGRDTTGVKGIALSKDDEVVGMVVIKREATVLVVTEKGMGKCSKLEEYRVQQRGGKGIITVNRTERTGGVVTIMEVLPEDEIMLITKHGVIIRSSVAQVRVTGRIAQGVKLVQLDDGDLVTAVARVVPEEEGEGETDEAPAGAPDDAV